MSDLREKVARAICEAQDELEPPEVLDSHYYRLADAAIAVVEKEAAPGVKVKPLEWGYHPVGIMAADNVGHSYIIDTRGQRPRFIKWPQGHAPDVESLEQAKAAAQADYEARILSTLEPFAPTVQEAAREIEKATRAFSAGVFSDNGDVTLSTGHLKTQNWLRLSAAQRKLTNALRAIAEDDTHQ